jgi:hypothetical protein
LLSPCCHGDGCQSYGSCPPALRLSSCSRGECIA